MTRPVAESFQQPGLRSMAVLFFQWCQRTDGRASRYTDSLPHMFHCLAPTDASDSIKELLKVSVQTLISPPGLKPVEERAVFASFS